MSFWEFSFRVSFLNFLNITSFVFLNKEILTRKNGNFIPLFQIYQKKRISNFYRKITLEQTKFCLLLGLTSKLESDCIFHLSSFVGCIHSIAFNWDIHLKVSFIYWNFRYSFLELLIIFCIFIHFLDYFSLRCFQVFIKTHFRIKMETVRSLSNNFLYEC